MRLLVLPLLAACWGQNAYIVEGTVVEVPSATEVVVDHEAIAGFMGPMVMTFGLDPSSGASLRPGDRIVGRLRVDEGRAVLEKVRVTGYAPLPAPPVSAVVPVRPGEVLPRIEIPVAGGGTWTVGEGQGAPTLLTFLYTTCPLPEFCPLTLARLQGLQPQLPPGSRALAVTVDPVHDSLDVLAAYAAQAGARPEVWGFGRVEPQALADLARRAGLSVLEEDGKILHAIRWLVLDADGRLVERYDDNALPADRVVQQLATGGPPAPPNTAGTLTPTPQVTPP